MRIKVIQNGMHERHTAAEPPPPPRGEGVQPDKGRLLTAKISICSLLK